MSTTADHWQDFFENWPGTMARGGMLVTTFGEQIPFGGFSIKDSLILIQRNTPDNVGARHLLIPFEAISALKITEVVSNDVFTKAGFTGEPVTA